jgi:hypothetical protein
VQNYRQNDQILISEKRESVTAASRPFWSFRGAEWLLKNRHYFGGVLRRSRTKVVIPLNDRGAVLERNSGAFLSEKADRIAGRPWQLCLSSQLLFRLRLTPAQGVRIFGP